MKELDMSSREYAHRSFDADIEVLRSTVTTMAGLVERQLVRAIESIRRQDPQLVAAVLLDEQRVNQLQVDSDLRCNRTIARRQPIAIDLREIIAVIHIVNDLERIGDEAKKIALRSRDFAAAPSPIGIDGIERMASRVRRMFDAAVDAFVRHDASVAAQLEAIDGEVDDLRDRLVGELMQAMAQQPASVTSGVAAVFVVQSIERVGDHAKNIAEHVALLVEGVDLRQAPLDSGRETGEEG
jgi:phosphate transport system protein